MPREKQARWVIAKAARPSRKNENGNEKREEKRRRGGAGVELGKRRNESN